MGEALSKARPRPVELTRDTIQEFMQRYDTVVSDLDGVVWTPVRMIPGSKEGLESLRAAGKRTLFATNNSVLSSYKKFERLGYKVERDEVVFPAIVIADHLQQIGFKKKAFVLGVEHFKSFLREKGITVVPERQCPEYLEENLASYLKAIQIDPEVGAIIVDLDININMLELSQAVNHLRNNKDCLFFVGASDTYVTFQDNKALLGPYHFIRLIEQCSDRKPIVVGKPGSMMIENYLKKIHNLDLKRSVFVGDTLMQDMGVAAACGMGKLLVLTGVSQLSDLDDCDPSLIPDYYIKSLAEFSNLLAPAGKS
ncbi:hypothetical protein ONE63_006737 [Megalurothrips usitatus]|uniref:Pyridoxal phosphate phosphatase n=1 Tax=Megalurothrips usitatus TaxID=439358 RepID=A0AAV7XPU4_9NEOP|nr:hypothetical protein ONE63_006737 [Megalurothrips usitatus]